MKKLLSWLAENPADRAILFNESRASDVQGSAAKPQARCKQEIKAVIASIVFGQDTQYGELYAKQPGKFAIAVGKHLTRYVFSPYCNWNHLQYVSLTAWKKSIETNYQDSSPLVRVSTQMIHAIRTFSVCTILILFLQALFLKTIFILEEVTTDFPFWDACHEMWHGNPAYGATSFNATAGAKRTQDYLSKIEWRGTTTWDDPAAEDNPGEEDFGGIVKRP